MPFYPQIPRHANLFVMSGSDAYIAIQSFNRDVGVAPTELFKQLNYKQPGRGVFLGVAVQHRK